MGVSGVGKTTVGRALAARLGWSFVDGDDLHPPENVAKMARGEPLSDVDRGPWLDVLHSVITDYRAKDRALVLACSALRTTHRARLVGSEPNVSFVHLTGDPALVASRLGHRHGHFMPAGLLPDQLHVLEPPQEAITVEVNHPVLALVEEITKDLGLSQIPGSGASE